MKKAVFLLVFPLLSCSNYSLDPVFTYYGSDQGFADAQIAAREWDKCGAQITITNAPNHTPMVEQLHITDDPTDKFGGMTYFYEGPAGKYVKRVELRTTDDPNRFTTVIAHELGHSLGLSHVPVGLMMPEQLMPIEVGMLECQHLWESQGINE